MPCEFFAQTRWDGTALTGMLFDRRPLADGNEVTATTLASVTDGSVVSETVSATLLGEPSTFRWSAFTEEPGELGTDVVRVIDAVPDTGEKAPATWPAK